MRLKTYRARTMAEALTQVKKDLGRDAVILHTRSVAVGGVLGFGRKTLIEITAADEATPASGRAVRAAKLKPEVVPSARDEERPILRATAARQAYQRAQDMGRRAEPARPVARATNIESAQSLSGRAGRGTPAEPAAEPTLMTVRERRIAEAQQQHVQQPMQMKAAAPAPRPVATSSQSAAPAEGGLYRELADIKLLVNQVLHSAPASSAGVAAGAMPDALFKHYLRLLEASVSRDIADGIVGAVRDELTPGEMLDEAIVRATVLRHIAGLIPVAETVMRPRADRGPLVIALIGPTGVGKTTTIAKLAAAYKLRHGKTVALVTSDTYRIAAVDQLRTYAGIIGLQLKVVMTPQEMGAAVQSLSNHDVVLIDTAGRSQFNADRIAELRDFIDAAAPTEVHLVLSSTANEAVLTRTAEAFAGLNPNRVILTKLDEAVNFGVIVNVARRLGTALSYVTTGQEVPDDLEPSQPDRLARMVLDNALAASGSARPRPAEVGATPGVGVAEREAMLIGAGPAGGWGGGR